MKNIYLYLVLLLLVPSLGSSAELVFDLNTARAPFGSNPWNLAMLGSTVYFFADDGVHGEELWRSDGTAAGTRMVADLSPGPRSSKTYRDVIKLNNAIYFFIASANTVNFYKIEEGKGPQKIATLENATVIPEAQIVRDRLFFVLEGTPYGSELWTMDEDSPRMVKDIYPGPGGQARQLTEFNGILYFWAYDSTHGAELWRSDGTESGTNMVRDIRPGEQGSDPNSLTPFAGRLVFSANDGIHGAELWKTDGTELGTSMIRDLISGPEGIAGNTYGPLPVLMNKLFFDGTFDQLYQMDAGLNMSLLRDIDPNKDACCISFLKAGANYIFFAAKDPQQGTSLWRSDGTSAGTQMVADPYPNERSYLFIHEVIGDQVLFVTWGSPNSRLWLSDGTRNGTRVVASADTIRSVAGNGKIWFVSMGDDFDKTELFVFDSQNSLRLVKNLRVGNASSAPHHLTAHKGSLFFSASDEIGPGIWGTDGKTARLFYRGEAQRIARTSDAIYFVDEHQKLFRIDMERKVRELNVGNFDNYGPMRGVGSKLFFSNYDNIVATDGTPSGTRAVEGPRAITHLTLLGNSLYTIDSQETLWQIDTTTLQSRKVFTGNSEQDVLNLSVGNNSLYFVVKTQGRTEFWKSNGTSGSNVKIAETNLETTYFALSYPHWFFNGRDEQYGTEPRMLDLTTNKIVLVKDIVPGNASSSPRPYAAFDGTLIFSIGWNTWRSDGTEQGTYILSKESSDCFSVAGSRLYFTTNPQNTGNEPYVLDLDGASLVQDVYRGPYSSQACEFTFFNGSVYFAATDALHGRELWRVPLSP